MLGDAAQHERVSILFRWSCCALADGVRYAAWGDHDSVAIAGW